MKLYKLISGYGEDPIRASLILVCLLVLSIGAHSLSFPSGSLSNTWQNYFYFLKGDSAQPKTGQALQIVSKTAIALQASLMGFALRNKLRR